MPRIINWKRLYGGRIFLYWWNKQADTGIEVTPIKKGIKWNTMWVWRVLKNNQVLKEFKTKKEALKFAINWMREHPNG